MKGGGAVGWLGREGWWCWGKDCVRQRDETRQTDRQTDDNHTTPRHLSAISPQFTLRSCMTMLRMAVRPADSLPATTDRSRSRTFLYVSRCSGLISQKTSVSVFFGSDVSTSAWSSCWV